MGNLKKSERLTKQELNFFIGECHENAEKHWEHGHYDLWKQEMCIANFIQTKLIDGYKWGHEPDESDINYNYKIRGFPLGVLVQIANIMASQEIDLKCWESVDYFDNMTLHDSEWWEKAFRKLDKKIKKEKKKNDRRSSKR